MYSRIRTSYTRLLSATPTYVMPRVMGSLLGFVRIDHAPVLEKLIDPRIRIVSLCITEGAYFY